MLCLLSSAHFTRSDTNNSMFLSNVSKYACFLFLDFLSLFIFYLSLALSSLQKRMKNVLMCGGVFASMCECLFGNESVKYDYIHTVQVTRQYIHTHIYTCLQTYIHMFVHTLVFMHAVPVHQSSVYITCFLSFASLVRSVC